MTLSAISALAGNKSHVPGSRDGTLRRFYRGAIFGLHEIALLCVAQDKAGSFVRLDQENAFWGVFLRVHLRGKRLPDLMRVCARTPRS
jgi:hypothetical protein